MGPVFWVWQVRTPGLQVSHAPAYLKARFQNREPSLTVSTVQVTGAPVDLLPMTGKSLKPGLGSRCPNTGAERRGPWSQPTLCLCPFRRGVLCHTVGLSNNGLVQPRSSLLPQLLAVVIWLCLTLGCSGKGWGCTLGVPECSWVLRGAGTLDLSNKQASATLSSDAHIFYKH